MKLILRILFVGIVLAVLAVTLGEAVFARQADDQSAASRVGTTLTWPDAIQAADPDEAQRILAEASGETGSNVIRTSVGTTESGRTQITHYIYLEQESTRLYGEFTLAEGRWLDRAESRTGSAVVSSSPPAQAEHVGTPRVLADGYDLTFAPLHEAFDSLPAAGQYVIEAPDAAAADRFLEIVTQRLVETGMVDLTIEDLLVDETSIARIPRDDAVVQYLPYMLIAIATFLIGYFLLRQGKSIGVMRLSGYSATRIWYRTVGRLWVVSTLAGIFLSAAVTIFLSGGDSAFAWSLAEALLRVTAITLGITLIAGLVVISRVQTRDLIKNRSLFGPGIAAPTVGVKLAFGVLFALATLQVWQLISDLGERHRVADNWTESRDYAVFFPHSTGDDLVEFTSGGNATTIAEARDLYPVLEEMGAIFIDAYNYESEVPADPRLPAPTIRVNVNYLDRYPILDKSRSPISVDRNEQAWIVAVPEQYKAREAEIDAHFRGMRVGGQTFEGVVQAEERIVGHAPSRFRDQEVRIIWTANSQEIFSFNSRVNPETASVIVDPIVEIMTPVNSLTVDRFNAITGEINTPLKVRVDGDPESVLRNLLPTLEVLNLDDNLQHLVTANEAALRELDDLRLGIVWAAVAAGVSLVVVLALGASLVTTLFDQLQRAFTVRRLHGFGFARTYRELLTLLGVTWLAQALVAVTVVAVGGSFAEVPRLLAILAVASVVEALFAAAAVTAVERRNAVQQLKEL